MARVYLINNSSTTNIHCYGYFNTLLINLHFLSYSFYILFKDVGALKYFSPFFREGRIKYAMSKIRVYRVIFYLEIWFFKIARDMCPI